MGFPLLFGALPLPLSHSTELRPQQGLVGPCRAPRGGPFPHSTSLRGENESPPPQIHTQLPQKHRNHSQLNRVGALIAGNAAPTISSECTAGSNQAQPGGENGVPSPEVKLLPLGSNSTMEAAAFPIEPPQSPHRAPPAQHPATWHGHEQSIPSADPQVPPGTAASAQAVITPRAARIRPHMVNQSQRLHQNGNSSGWCGVGPPHTHPQLTTTRVSLSSSVSMSRLRPTRSWLMCILWGCPAPRCPSGGPGGSKEVSVGAHSAMCPPAVTHFVPRVSQPQ